MRARRKLETTGIAAPPIARDFSESRYWVSPEKIKRRIEDRDVLKHTGVLDHSRFGIRELDHIWRMYTRCSQLATPRIVEKERAGEAERRRPLQSHIV